MTPDAEIFLFKATAFIAAIGFKIWSKDEFKPFTDIMVAFAAIALILWSLRVFV